MLRQCATSAVHAHLAANPAGFRSVTKDWARCRRPSTVTIVAKPCRFRRTDREVPSNTPPHTARIVAMDRAFTMRSVVWRDEKPRHPAR